MSLHNTLTVALWYHMGVALPHNHRNVVVTGRTGFVAPHQQFMTLGYCKRGVWYDITGLPLAAENFFPMCWRDVEPNELPDVELLPPCT